MTPAKSPTRPRAPKPDKREELMRRYGCGSIPLAGTADGFYERFPAKGQLERVRRVHQRLLNVLTG